MSVSSINNNVPSYINLSNRAERINAIDNRIVANNRQIVALENQIAAQKEVSSVTREMIANNTNSINLTKDIISLKKEIVGNNEKLISNNEKRIANNTDTINLTKQLITNNEKLIGAHKEHRGLLQESRDLTQQMVDCVEKMLAIMMKNPAKYGSLDKSQFQQLPEVVETKKNLTEVVAIKLNQYPKKEHAGLMDTAKKVIDRSFYEINTTDLSSNKKIFLNLERNIDTALAEQYALVKDDYISTIRNYRIIQKLFYNFSSLNIKNLKI